MRFDIRVFSGIRPQRAAQLLGENEAQTAENVKLVSGELRPYDNELKNDDIQGSTLVKTIYLFRSAYWLEWTADVDVVEGPVLNDTAYRFYFTGSGIPKKSNLTEATTGAGAMPINFYSMASPQPSRQPAASNAGGGSGDDRSILYTWTVVTSWGEESAPAPASSLLTAKQGDTVNLSNMDLTWQASTTVEESDFIIPTVPNGYIYKCVTGGVTAGVEPTWGTTVDGDTTDGTATWRAYEDTVANKYIYRYNTGEVGGNYQFVASIAAATTIYADSKTDTELGEVLQTGYGTKASWDPPPDDLLGIVGLPGGILAGFKGKDVYFSYPYQPHAWPAEYAITLEYPVVGLSVMENNLVVATEQNPYIITGTSPESMTPNKMPDAQPCLSKRGIVTFPNGVLYPTTDGLCLVSNGRAVVITEGFFTKKEWSDYYPATMVGAYHDGKYFGFYDTGTFDGDTVVVDFQRKDVTTVDLGDASSTNYAPGIYVDPTSDTLYYIKQTAEVLLQIGGTSYPTRTNRWVQIGSGDSILLIGDL